MEETTIIEVVKVTLKDINQLQKIGKQTFSETFSDANTQENMANYFLENFSIEKLSKELNDKDAEFYFAKFGEKIVGYLKLNFGQSQTELQDHKGLEIERIYVTKEFHGKQFGQLLFHKALEIAKHNQCEFIWLGVWEKNLRAINFYKKNRFVEFDQHLFKLGNDLQTDIMMKLKLEK